MLQSVVNWFLALPENLQPAVLATLSQGGLFVLGFFTIAGTAWANRRNTLKAARDQQRLEIYKDMLEIIQAARDAQLDADGYLRGAVLAVRFHSDVVEQGLSSSPPRQRFPEFLRRHSEQTERASAIHLRLEQWALIDHRLDAFRKAFGFQSNSLMKASIALNQVLMRLLPTDSPQGGIFPYTPAQGQHLAQLGTLAESYHRESGLLGCYIGDLIVELQPLLLGHLFGHRIVRRDPPDPSQFAIRLDRYKEIVRHFDDTEFFKDGARLDRELRLQYGTQKTLWRRLRGKW